jgi:hypothetical protein
MIPDEIASNEHVTLKLTNDAAIRIDKTVIIKSRGVLEIEPE